MDQTLTADPDPGADAPPVRPAYAEAGPSLLWLACRSAGLTVLTLGVYRFWMTTRLRRHYWGATHLLDDPFEYSGTGLEKLLGFLLALVILAAYLTAVNLGLAFVGLVQFDDPLALQAVLNLSLFASLPLIYFATYRARRYVLSRTRWRGVRFGMDVAAWSYTGQALLYTLVTVASLGLLYPLQHFRLARFMTDRTWFGDVAFRQGGTWRALLGYWLWVYAGVAILIAGVVMASQAGENAAANANAAGVMVLGYLVMLALGLRYQVAAFRYLWGQRTLGPVRFASDVRTGRVLGINLIGYAATAGIVLLIGAVVVMLALLIWLGIVGVERIEVAMLNIEDGALADEAWPLFAVTGAGYLVMIAAATALVQVFLARPLLRAYAQSLSLTHAHALAGARQRRHDPALEAGGFADALGVDVGAGF